MVNIYNTKLTEELKDGIKLQQLNDVVPSQLADKVVPVMEVNPRMLLHNGRVIATSGLDATPLTLVIPDMTGKYAKKTYITGAFLSYEADVLATATSIRIRYTPNDGVEQILINLQRLTLTVGNGSLAISFPVPLQCVTAPYIDISGGVAAGHIAVSGGVSYYQEDVV